MKTRKLTAMEKKLREKYTTLNNWGRNRWSASLNIDHQGFKVVDDATRARAEWYRDMLAIALARMVNECMKDA